VPLEGLNAFHDKRVYILSVDQYHNDQYYKPLWFSVYFTLCYLCSIQDSHVLWRTSGLAIKSRTSLLSIFLVLSHMFRYNVYIKDMRRWTPWRYVIDVHDTLLQAMLRHTALLATLCHFVVTNGFQDGNWKVLTLCPWFESDILRNYKSVLNEIWFQMLPRIWLIWST
jgi:hypothetical protein